MHTTTVRNARNNLTKLLRLVQNGDEIVIRSRNLPIAKIVPFKASEKKVFPDLTEFRKKLLAKSGLMTDSTAGIREDRDRG